jgi:hypothetical protein
VNLIDFAKRCAVDEPRARINRLIEVVEQTLAKESELLEVVPAVAKALRANIDMFSGSRLQIR